VSAIARILILDKDADLAECWRRAFESQGHETHVRGDVYSALNLVEEAPPQVAITEIVLPGLGGIAFTGRVKLKDSAIKVIAVTGDPGALAPGVGALALARRVGADLLMEKPIKTSALLAAVDRLLADA
jgi:DNA-binding response OmpR family regulator